ncbi:energy-coupling factor transporter transmembrane protein EcfT [Roseibium sp. CAU 1637]|uniref:Energy-coupling factor transporter transmembrane protein EcfT n=1 Tax=Roseibium limicola TaxID=2816037 RepID=A0A939EUC5_9HYPH|nr:energy-coupling factor transporter transmembrane protein EcfT [Roseibium limicola]
MISLYHPGTSWLHRLPAGGKLIALAVVSLALMSQTSLPMLGAALGVTLVLYRSLGPGWVGRLAVIRSLLPLALVLLAFHGLTGDWLLGAAVALRLVVLMTLANLVTLTTRMDAMLAAVEPLFRPLSLFGISPRVPSLAVVLVIRFVPVLHQVQLALREAWQARGGRKSSWRIVPPLIIQALKLADHVADALSARGGASGMVPSSGAMARQTESV